MSDENNPFSIPEGLVEKIYEISGDSEKHKGVIMIVANESGDPIIYTKFDSTLTEMGLRKGLEEYIYRPSRDTEGEK